MSVIQLNQSYQIVALPDDFIVLKHVDATEYTFELKYTFDQHSDNWRHE